MIRGQQNSHYSSIYGGYLKLQRMVIKDDMKLIVYPELKKTLLYDLKTDPLEMNDLAQSPDRADTIKKLFAELLKLQTETGDELDLKTTYAELMN